MLGSPVSAQCGLRGFRLYELVVGTRWTIARRVVIGWPSWSYEDQGYGGSRQQDHRLGGQYGKAHVHDLE